MKRFPVLIMCALIIACMAVMGQSIPPAVDLQTPYANDPTAVFLAQKSVAALAGGNTIRDVSMSADVISTFGSDRQSGTGVFSAKGIDDSRVDLNLTDGTRTDVRNHANGVPSGSWMQDGASATSYAQHNCWSDAPWFFPAFSSLTQTANSSYVFKYMGQEQYTAVNVQHIQVIRIVRNDITNVFQRLSTTDFYLDANTNLPLAITSTTHPDNDVAVNIRVEVHFANYQALNGVLVPFHFQQMLNGSVVLEATITNVVFNTDLPDNLFTLP